MHKGYGIAHILDKHGEQIVKMIGEVIGKGTVHDVHENKLKIVYKNYVAIIRKEIFGVRRNVLITCYEKTKESEESKTRREQRKNRK